MTTHKHIDWICVTAAALAALMSLGLLAGAAGNAPAGRVMGYEERLFDTSRVHTIDIIMDDWDGFIESCENEEYAPCSVVIDGESMGNVGIRAKGNTSLSTVSSMDSDRYSFKIEFDQYQKGKNYYGLDKLSLNNLIQDATMMKDHLTYRLMNSFGAAAPLSSYVYITVNGEDWGLYLAVEGVEEAFLERNFGSDYGELYKPDSMSFGGGRGNGRDFDFSDFENMPDMGEIPDTENVPDMGEMPDMSNMPDMESMPDMDAMRERFQPGNMPDMGGSGGFGGMGSSDVKLQYTDDDPESYSNIFDQAKTEVSEADETRLIASLKALSEGKIENTVDIDRALRYFVVHNFVVNGDSYTGSMVHNYYLYEEDGLLSMIPWDYNLAYGTFQGGNASSSVNDPIDTPLSVDGSGDRPMADWIVSSQEYAELYHQYFADFLDSTDFAAIIDETAALIAPYVQKDPTAFYTYDEFTAGVAALRQFCLLREESVQGQLAGTIPSTDEDQNENGAALIDTGDLNLSDMGTMNMGGGKGGPGGNFGNFGGDRGNFENRQGRGEGTKQPPS